jgi:hypothetical protein
LFHSREKYPVQYLKYELKKKLKGHGTPVHENNLSLMEKETLTKVRLETENYNLNNVTRTKAYLDFYKDYPEVHWSFLAHMVSRNGGWNMTDLKGEHLPRILSSEERKSFFSFLERSNWLIFQDAYPQLLVYRESLRLNKPLFYLFPYINISSFVEFIWNYFWSHRDSQILTFGLIINEQNYLETRVVQNSIYKNKVLNTPQYLFQDLLSFTQILFPYKDKGLVGETVHHFHSLNERVLIGKRLYNILFKNSQLFNGVRDWALKHPHTGSRKDYWPHIFNNVNEGIPGTDYQLRLKSCQLSPGARKIYSPGLEQAWKNVSQPAAEKGDWFKDLNASNFLEDDLESINGEIVNEYCKTLERLELAALAKKAISILE